MGKNHVRKTGIWMSSETVGKDLMEHIALSQLPAINLDQETAVFKVNTGCNNVVISITSRELFIFKGQKNEDLVESSEAEERNVTNKGRENLAQVLI